MVAINLKTMFNLKKIFITIEFAELTTKSKI